MSTLAKVCYWIVGIGIVTNFVFMIWITIGGIFDSIHMIEGLKAEVVDETDDGRVIASASDQKEQA